MDPAPSDPGSRWSGPPWRGSHPAVARTHRHRTSRCLSGGVMRIDVAHSPPLPIRMRFSRAASMRRASRPSLASSETRSSTSSMRLHQPHAANIADERVLILQFFELPRRYAPVSAALIRKLLLINEVDHSLGCGRGNRIAAERRNRHAFERIGELRACHGQANRRSIGQTLGAGDDVRVHAPLLNAEPLAAGAAPAGLHFVADKNAAVFANDVIDDREIFLRRRDESADALNRLGDKCRRCGRKWWCGSAPPHPARISLRSRDTSGRTGSGSNRRCARVRCPACVTGPSRQLACAVSAIAMRRTAVIGVPQRDDFGGCRCSSAPPESPFRSLQCRC